MENQKSNKINKLKIDYLNLLNSYEKEISQRTERKSESETLFPSTKNPCEEFQ